MAEIINFNFSQKREVSNSQIGDLRVFRQFLYMFLSNDENIDANVNLLLKGFENFINKNELGIGLNENDLHLFNDKINYYKNFSSFTNDLVIIKEILAFTNLTNIYESYFLHMPDDVMYGLASAFASINVSLTQYEKYASLFLDSEINDYIHKMDLLTFRYQNYVTIIIENLAFAKPLKLLKKDAFALLDKLAYYNSRNIELFKKDTTLPEMHKIIIALMQEINECSKLSFSESEFGTIDLLLKVQHCEEVNEELRKRLIIIDHQNWSLRAKIDFFLTEIFNYKEIIDHQKILCLFPQK